MVTEERVPCPNGQPDHYWIVEPSHGPTSNARCVYCDAEKIQHNYIPGLEWTEGSGQNKEQQRARKNDDR